MRKTKYFIILFLTLGIFVFTSCVDYVQAISFDGERYNGYYRVTLSKMFLGDTDEEENGEKPPLDEEVLNSLPKGIEVKDFENDLEVGFEIRFLKKKNELSEELLSLIPFYERTTNRYLIPFPIGKEMQENEELVNKIENQDEDNEMVTAMASMMLSNVKFRIMVDKSIIPLINKAYFEGLEGGDIYPLTFYDYGNGFCIEVPAFLFTAPLPYNFTNIITQ